MEAKCIIVHNLLYCFEITIKEKFYPGVDEFLTTHHFTIKLSKIKQSSACSHTDKSNDQGQMMIKYSTIAF
jgi:hypothetical protein